MAKNSVRDFSSTAASNTDIQSIDIDENCAASGINNAIREVMADLKDVSVGTVALESPKFDSILDGNIKATDASGTDAAGTATTIKGGAGTGTGTGGSIIFQVADGAGSTGSSVNAHATAMTIADDGNVSINNDLTVDTDTLYVDSTNNYVGIGTSSPNTKVGFAIGNDITISQVAGTAHQAGNAGSVGLTISDGGGHSGVFVNNSHDGTYSDQFITFKTAEGGITSATEHMRIDPSGTVSFHGISGRPTPSTGHMAISEQSDNRSYIELATTTSVNRTLMAFINSNGTVGSIVVGGSSTSYQTTSDYRLKENVTADWDATTRLKQLNPVRFNFIADPDKTVDGFLAHEVQDVVPEAITGTKDEVDDDGNPEYQGIDQSKLVPLLVKTIQELESRITALENA